MPFLQTLATVSCYAFGAMCIGSAAPLVGLPFPSRATADYYRGKSEWNSRLSGGRLSPAQSGWVLAALRVLIGVGSMWPPTREVTLLINGAVVTRGTFLAKRDGRPMVPQWTMLAMVGWCLAVNRLGMMYV